MGEQESTSDVSEFEQVKTKAFEVIAEVEKLDTSLFLQFLYQIHGVNPSSWKDLKNQVFGYLFEAAESKNNPTICSPEALKEVKKLIDKFMGIQLVMKSNKLFETT